MKKKTAVVCGTAAVVLALGAGIFIGKTAFSGENPESTIQEKVTEDAEKSTAEPEDAEKGTAEPEGAAEEENPEKDVQSQVMIYDVEDGYMQVPLLSGVPKHTYDFSRLTEQDGKKYYVDEEGNRSRIGIDVSYFQNEIDFKKVKESGIEFVILRLGYRGYGGEGKLVVDERFHSYMQAAKEAGLATGVYFFSQAINIEEAREEAEFVRQQCEGYEIDGPMVFDTEKIKNDTARTDGLTPGQLTDITLAFCEKVKEYGYEPMIYANAKWLTTKLELDRLLDYEVWYADYQETPLYPYEFAMWQYREDGQVDGIEGMVDMNIWFPKE